MDSREKREADRKNGFSPVHGEFEIVDEPKDILEVIDEAEGEMPVEPKTLTPGLSKPRESWNEPKTPEEVAPTAIRPRKTHDLPKGPDVPPIALEKGDEDAHRWIRRLYLVQGWEYGKIARHLHLTKTSVKTYIVRSGLDVKKKDGDWSAEDLLLPAEEAQKVVERSIAQEKAQIEAARQVGEEQAGKVIEAVLTREQIAKDALMKIVDQAAPIAERIGTAIEHIQEHQEHLGHTDIRDLKELTTAYLNLVRSARELAGEKNFVSKEKQDKRPPMRIGVMGNVKISQNGVEMQGDSAAITVD